METTSKCFEIPACNIQRFERRAGQLSRKAVRLSCPAITTGGNFAAPEVGRNDMDWQTQRDAWESKSRYIAAIDGARS